MTEIGRNLTCETFLQSLNRNWSAWGCLGSTDWLTSINQTCKKNYSLSMPRKIQIGLFQIYHLLFKISLPVLYATACCTHSGQHALNYIPYITVASSGRKQQIIFLEYNTNKNISSLIIYMSVCLSISSLSVCLQFNTAKKHYRTWLY